MTANTADRKRPFAQVDVFSAVPLKGNALAVVIDSTSPEISTEAQAAFANWTNLSETTFLYPPTDPREADYKVRIWTTSGELPFAGHPTLGSCQVWLDHVFNQDRPFVSGQTNVITQECGIGLVRIKKDAQTGRLALGAPDFLKYEPAKEEEIQTICDSMDIQRSDVIKAQWTDNGPGWVTLLLKSAQAVLKAKRTSHTPKGLNFGIVGPYKSGAPLLRETGLITDVEAQNLDEEADVTEKGLQPATFEVRAIFDNGQVEDPTTGSLNAGIAKWLISEGLAPNKFISSQGTAINRRGRVYVEKDTSGDGTIWVGGDTCSVINGFVTL
ncbi:unnamed protein product [Sympodiomycopsis kandeliae]